MVFGIHTHTHTHTRVYINHVPNCWNRRLGSKVAKEQLLKDERLGIINTLVHVNFGTGLAKDIIPTHVYVYNMFTYMTTCTMHVYITCTIRVQHVTYMYMYHVHIIIPVHVHIITKSTPEYMYMYTHPFTPGKPTWRHKLEFHYSNHEYNLTRLQCTNTANQRGEIAYTMWLLVVFDLILHNRLQNLSKVL